MATWSSWLWGSGPKAPLRPTDASHDTALRAHFLALLDNVEPPAVFRPSDVAQLIKQKELDNMGYKEWKEAIPAIRELAFELRALDYCEVLHRGVVLGDDIDLLDVEGPIRIRRVEKYVAKVSDDW
ncbi:hypothetical protein LTR10_001055 [Elasticomyces elasticus]|nr:hypothetical protein LTR10_001055 [Elasticomyces elasticus]KAK4979701.1 hypothetical protein LTR42_000006 [Elasticomyces elasticus]KAK5687242.1 hypothetical protein LTS10_001380 [Elasticomyces elasticus]